MQSVSHSFRQERQRQVLRHSNLLWVSSLAMGLVCVAVHPARPDMWLVGGLIALLASAGLVRSEEHTSELQSHYAISGDGVGV